MSKSIAASLCAVVVLASGCGSSATPGTSPESAARPSPHATGWAPVSRTGVEVDDLAEGPDTTTTHGVIEADNFIQPTGKGADSEARLAGGGVLAFIGAKISSAGGCTLYAPAPTTGANAGVITVSTTKQTDTLDPSGSGKSVSYGETTSPTFPFAEGVVTFSAAGTPAVPAFTGTVHAPKQLAGFVVPTAINRKRALTLDWTVESGKIAVYIFAAQVTDAGTGPTDILRCPTTDTGTFTVPTTALALLPANDNAGFVAVTRYAETHVTSGNVDVTLVVNQISESAGIPIN